MFAAVQARAVVEERLRAPPGPRGPSGIGSASQLDGGNRQALQSIGLAGVLLLLPAAAPLHRLPGSGAWPTSRMCTINLYLTQVEKEIGLFKLVLESSWNLVHRLVASRRVGSWKAVRF